MSTCPVRAELLLLLVTLFAVIPVAAQSCTKNCGQSSVNEKEHGPDCSGAEHWAAMMSLASMKNAQLIAPKEIDSAKTKAVRLASEKIGSDLWRQVYDVTFTMKSGQAVEAIAVHDASNEECSMSGVDVFVVSSRLPASQK